MENATTDVAAQEAAENNGREAVDVSAGKGSPLTLRQILEADDIRTVRVAVPEWGGFVLVRAMTGRQRDELEATLLEGRGRNREVNLSNFRAKLLAASMVDDSGRYLTTDPRDIERLAEKSSGAMTRVVDAARKLSGMSDDDVESLVEDFDNAPSGDSGSD